MFKPSKDLVSLLVVMKKF